MKHITAIIGTLLFLPIAFVSCKTSEANYRAAYEKAIEGREESAPLDETIYGDVRRRATTRTVTAADGRQIEVRSQLVRFTKDCGGIPENLRQFNVVAGQFKQLFNARSLRNRLADAGYSGAIVVETAEPFYYVVATSSSEVGQAADALEKLRANPPVVMKEPAPFILDATNTKK